MKHELELKLMACLDGELPEREAREITVLVEQDPQARALLDELRQTRAALHGQETIAQVPESREFYWSKIERSIQRETAATVGSSLSWLDWMQAWRRWLAPVAGAAVIALLAVGGAIWANRDAAASAGWHLAEVEDLSDQVQSHVFRAGNMMVVWVDTQDTRAPSNWEPTEPPIVQ